MCFDINLLYALLEMKQVLVWKVEEEEEKKKQGRDDKVVDVQSGRVEGVLWAGPEVRGDLWVGSSSE